MRKATIESVKAFENDFTYNKGNTVVKTGYGKTGIDFIDNKYEGNFRVTTLSLFGNDIAYRINSKDLYITNAGWDSKVTKERLNGLPGVSIIQKKGVWYLNDYTWDGGLIRIGSEPEAKKEGPNGFGLMKGFLMFGDLSSSGDSLADKVAYKEKIIFSTMKASIPDWTPPANWGELSDQEKMDRLNKIQEIA